MSERDRIDEAFEALMHSRGKSTWLPSEAAIFRAGWLACRAEAVKAARDGKLPRLKGDVTIQDYRDEIANKIQSLGTAREGETK